MPNNPHAWPEGTDRRVLAEVNSTNSEAARIADGLSRPTWILGLRQTAGRGRRGRAWSDPDGNFAATLVMPMNDPPAIAAQRSFTAALALREALVALTARPEGFALKWPNDLLLNGAKAAGILLEATSSNGRSGPLSVGIGVNLLVAPIPSELRDGAVAPTSVLSGTGVSIPPEALLDVLAPAFARWEARLQDEGFAPVRDAFLTFAAGLGQAITVRLQRETLQGTFDGIDDSGALLLLTPKGRLRVPAGDVFF